MALEHASTTSRRVLANTAATRSQRVGKWRYRVALPVPAARAMSSRGASRPRCPNVALAAATSASRFRAASERSVTVSGVLTAPA